MVGHAVITEEALERLRQRIGVPVSRRHPHVQLASHDAIRHFAHGMGDANPLWTDPEYAATTRYGSVIAPPCMLYAMDDICSGQFGGLAGIHNMFAGTRFEWFQPIKAGDTITAVSALHALEERVVRDGVCLEVLDELRRRPRRLRRRGHLPRLPHSMALG